MKQHLQVIPWLHVCTVNQNIEDCFMLLHFKMVSQKETKVRFNFFLCSDYSQSVFSCVSFSPCPILLREGLHQSMWETAHWSAIIPSVLWHQARAEALHRIHGCCGMCQSPFTLLVLLSSPTIFLLLHVSLCCSVSVTLVFPISLWFLPWDLPDSGPWRARNRKRKYELGPLPALGSSTRWRVGWA